MPSIQQRAAVPTLQNDTLSIPSTFPSVPATALRANPDLGTWNDDINAWWKKTRQALGDLTAESASAAQQVQSASQSLKASGNGFTAAIDTERQARIDADGALAIQITTISAAYQSADAALSASITTEQTARVTQDTALATSITTLNSTLTTSIGTVSAAVTSEASTRASADSVIASNITSLSATVTSNNSTLTALVTSEQTARITQDGILAAQIATLAASSGNHVFLQASTSTPTATGVGDLWYQTDNGDKVYVWNGSAWVDGSDQRISTNAAAITTEQSARISGDSSLATSISSVLSIANGNTAAITSEQTARTTADTSLTNSISTLNSTVTSNNSTLTSAISTEATTRASADGNLSGKYTLTVTAGNVVTGMNITSSTGGGTNISSVIFNAANFQIYNTSTSTGVAPFQVSGGNVTVTGSLIIHPTDIQGTAVVAGGAASDVNSNTTTINGGKITTGTVTLSTLNFTPATTSNIIGTINSSTETGTLLISASRLQINGSVTFASGYDPTGKIASGGAAADVNAGTTTINGNMISTGTVTANKINVSNLSSIVSDLGTITAGSITVGSGTQQAQLGAGMLKLGHITMTSSGTSADTVMQLQGGDLSYINLNATISSLSPASIIGYDTGGSMNFELSTFAGLGSFSRFGLMKSGTPRLMYYFGFVQSPVSGGTSALFDFNVSAAGFSATPQIVLVQSQQGLGMHCEYLYGDPNNSTTNIRVQCYLQSGGSMSTGTLYRFGIFVAEI